MNVFTIGTFFRKVLTKINQRKHCKSRKKNNAPGIDYECISTNIIILLSRFIFLYNEIRCINTNAILITKDAEKIDFQSISGDVCESIPDGQYLMHTIYTHSVIH